jgi:acetaldehyde dehydrogenase (acetylating)
VLSLYFVQDFNAPLDICFGLLKFGGNGHTAAIHSKNDARIREYGLRMPAMRILVNTPAPQGSTGITTNVFPAMTLGCGAAAGNITSDNVGPQHLINIKRLAYTVRTARRGVRNASSITIRRRTDPASATRWGRSLPAPIDRAVP